MSAKRVAVVGLSLVVAVVFAAACGGKKSHGSPQPTITSLVPDSGVVGTTVVVSGADFGSTQGGSTVTFGSATATVVTWSGSEITVHVPDVLPGAHPVTVTVGANDSNAAPFTVKFPDVVYAFAGSGATQTSALVAAWSWSTNGTLTQVSGSPYIAGVNNSGYGGDPHPIALDANHRRLFAAQDTGVMVWNIDGATGALTPVAGSPFSGGQTPSYFMGVDVTPDGAHVYTSAYGAGTIVGFDVATGGALTPIAGSPFPITPVMAPSSVRVSDDGACLFADNDTDSSLLGLHI
ncbi:MAG TPA: IPT/TIG domain-containing protein, partial [bacterium]|nr:IPT/TIG domain-containing protein [bacterium]